MALRITAGLKQDIPEESLKARICHSSGVYKLNINHKDNGMKDHSWANTTVTHDIPEESLWATAWRGECIVLRGNHATVHDYCLGDSPCTHYIHIR